MQIPSNFISFPWPTNNNNWKWLTEREKQRGRERENQNYTHIHVHSNNLCESNRIHFFPSQRVLFILFCIWNAPWSALHNTCVVCGVLKWEPINQTNRFPRMFFSLNTIFKRPSHIMAIWAMIITNEIRKKKNVLSLVFFNLRIKYTPKARISETGNMNAEECGECCEQKQMQLLNVCKWTKYGRGLGHFHIALVWGFLNFKLPLSTFSFDRSVVQYLFCAFLSICRVRSKVDDGTVGLPLLFISLQVSKKK